MSQENVEIVRQVYADWARNDMQSILAGCDPEMEIVQPPELPDAKSYRGHEGVLAAFEDWPKQWEEFRADLVEVIVVDDDRVISVNRQHLAARGIELQQDVAFLHTFKDGMATRLEMFFSVDEARAAVAPGRAKGSDS